MRHDKQIAIRLRKAGKSYKEIRDLLHIPKSTISDWLRSEAWSGKIRDTLAKQARLESKIRIRNLLAAKKSSLTQIYEEARQEALTEFAALKFHPLFIAALSLYWGEGDKVSRGLVRLANTDGLMIKLFVNFLSDICGVSENRIKVSLLIYPDLEETACKLYWANQTGLPQENFTKVIQIVGRHKTKRLQYGVCTVSTGSTYLKIKMNIWIELLAKELMNNYAGIVQG